jgi:hypothetical protein
MTRWSHARNRAGNHFLSATIRGIACSVVSREHGLFWDAAVRDDDGVWHPLGAYSSEGRAKQGCLRTARGMGAVANHV